MNAQSITQRLAAAPLALARKAMAVARGELRVVDTFAFREAAPYHRAGVVANRLGLQVARVAEEHASYWLRPSRPAPELQTYLDDYERDGILIVPDFLPRAEYDELRDEVTRSRERLADWQACTLGDNLVSEELRVHRFRQLYPRLGSFADHPKLKSLVEATTRRPINYPPLALLTFIRKPEPQKPYRDRTDDLLHADRHFPMVKVFYYVNDVDERNGPYTYVRRTNKLSLDRVRHEYDLSVREAKKRAGRLDEIRPDLLDPRGRNKVGDEWMERLGVKEEPIMARGNTLVLSNQFGWHRRGEFKGSEPRVVINLDYKYLESPARFLFPLLKRL